MKRANQQLEEKIRTEGTEAVNIEDIDQEQPHIEMARWDNPFLPSSLTCCPPETWLDFR